jgi:uncharacterized membrane protein
LPVWPKAGPPAQEKESVRMDKLPMVANTFIMVIWSVIFGVILFAAYKRKKRKMYRNIAVLLMALTVFMIIFAY